MPYHAFPLIITVSAKTPYILQRYCISNINQNIDYVYSVSKNTDKIWQLKNKLIASILISVNSKIYRILGILSLKIIIPTQTWIQAFGINSLSGLRIILSLAMIELLRIITTLAITHLKSKLIKKQRSPIWQSIKAATLMFDFTSRPISQKVTAWNSLLSPKSSKIEPIKQQQQIISM